MKESSGSHVGYLTDEPPLRGPHPHTAVSGGCDDQPLALGEVDGDDAAEVGTPGQEEGRGVCHRHGTVHTHAVVTDVPQLGFKKSRRRKNNDVIMRS